MDNNRNWQGWAALALAGLALLVALMGRNAGPSVTVAVGPDQGAGNSHMYETRPSPGGRDWTQAVPADPAEPQGRGGWRGQESAPPFGPGAHGFQHGPDGNFAGGHPRHGGFPFFLPFMLIGGLIKLAGVALIVMLLVRFFRSRRDRPQPPTSPTPQV